jgi:hypothetical protein
MAHVVTGRTVERGRDAASSSDPGPNGWKGIAADAEIVVTASSRELRERCGIDGDTANSSSSCPGDRGQLASLPWGTSGPAVFGPRQPALPTIEGGTRIIPQWPRDWGTVHVTHGRPAGPRPGAQAVARFTSSSCIHQLCTGTPPIVFSSPRQARGGSRGRPWLLMRCRRPACVGHVSRRAFRDGGRDACMLDIKRQRCSNPNCDQRGSVASGTRYTGCHYQGGWPRWQGIVFAGMHTRVTRPRVPGVD